MSDFYSIERAAAMAGISHVTLRTWARDGVVGTEPDAVLNEKQPLYTAGRVEEIKKMVQDIRKRGFFE